MSKHSSAGTIIISFFSGALGALVVLAIFLKLIILQAPSSLSDIARMIAGQIATPNTSGQQTAVLSDSQESQIIQTVQKAKPAVVSIVISKDVPVIERYFDEGELDPFFQTPQYRQNGTERQEVGGGSGFLASADGLIVTNKHVVSDEDADYTVFTNDGAKHEATVVARDPINDLAVLRIEGSGYPYLEFGDSDALQEGQSVIAIGNALAQFQNSVSVGIVSGLSRSITAGDGSGSSETLENVIQTDAAINPGNSGGPLLTLDGKVIGVNVAIVQGSQNIGFALPSSVARSVVESVSKTGRIVRPYLGVRYILINQQVKEQNQLTVDYGALVLRGETREELAVMPGSPADNAGIEESDIILEVDGVKLDSERSLSAIIRQKNVGDTVKLKILHRGEEKILDVQLAELPQ